MPNWYASRDALLRRIGTTATSENTMLGELLESVSRQIERETERWFFPKTATLYFTPQRSDRLLLDEDLLAVTTLKTDLDGDRTYETTWATTDYDLLPFNAPSREPSRPYSEIAVAPRGTKSFPDIERGVEIVGSWGYFDIREQVGTLGAAITDTTTTSVTMTGGHSVEVGHTLRIDDEQLFVSAVATNTLTVQRGVNGTTAATHSNGAVVRAYRYPVVSEACLLQAQLDYVTKDAPGGFRGGADVGGEIRTGGLHPSVWRKLRDAGLIRRSFA